MEIFRFSTYRAAEVGHVKKEVVREIELSFSEEDRQVTLEGRSRRNQGLVYPGFGRQHVVDPFVIPTAWTRYCAIDPGWRVFCVLWFAVEPNGNYYLYRELYLAGKYYADIANLIHAQEGDAWDQAGNFWKRTSSSERIEQRWIDPAAFGHYETGELKVAHLLNHPPHNIMCVPARNDVNLGIEMCARSLMPGVDGQPRMKVFSDCQNFLGEVRKYRRTKDIAKASRNETRDSVIKRDDHAMDCWRYAELGGLHFVEDQDKAQAEKTIEEFMEEFQAGSSRDERRRREWEEILARQQNRETNPPHPGGIGTVY